MSELLENAPKTVQRDFINKCEDGLVGAMGYAVAWTIENSIRKGTTAITAAVKEVTGAGEEYTVLFDINGKEFSSKWVREYGNWRIRTFGEIASGDKNLVAQKESKREAEKNLKTDPMMLIEGGYAQLFGDIKPAWSLYASATFFSMMGLRLYYNTDLMEIDVFVRAQFPIKVSSFAIIPFGTFGFSYVDIKGAPTVSSDPPPIQVGVQVGVKFTMATVPGLYAGLAFQFNFFDAIEFLHQGSTSITRYKTKALALSVGYAL
jgi:hypothetical protein